MANNTLDGKIKQFNREILALKTSHPVASNMMTFYYEFTFDNDQDGQNHKYEITYMSGTQPIITVGTFSNNTWDTLLGDVVSDKQVLFDMRAYHENNETYGLVSTRQIMGVRKLS